MTDTDKRGFTLIELMIVVAVLAVLSMVAIPKFADMMTRARESSAKANLGKIRGALSLYYSANEGFFPHDLSVLTAGGYIDSLPSAGTPAVPAQSKPAHPPNNGVEYYAARADFGSNNDDDVIWAYANGDDDRGQAGINCLHADTKGTVWSSY